MNSVENTDKTVDDAIKKALNTLKTTIDKVDVKVIDVGSKGFFGLGSRPVKVVVTLKFDPERLATDFLRDIIASMGLNVKIQTRLTEKQLYINMTGEELGILIGKRGQTLDSLQYLINLVVNKGNAPYISVTLDTENYRQRRKETLESLAFNLGKKAKQTRKKVILEPMNPYERRIIHSSLQGDRSIDTYSEGEEPFRYVVIMPK